MSFKCYFSNSISFERLEIKENETNETQDRSFIPESLRSTSLE